MTEHEREIVKALCARIVDEKNPVALLNLLVELDALLEKVNNHHPSLSEVESEDMAN